MNLLDLTHSTKNISESTISISGSKSESNRILILQALLKDNELEIYNLSNAQDTELMQTALSSEEKVIDIHHAGTAMRFLTAYFAVQEARETILTGSTRMKERPIGILVDALRQLGADIEYTENEGFPPLRIIGKKLIKNKVTISANVSSQYISALLLIGVTFEDGLIIELEGNLTSLPYLNMTIELISRFQIDATWIDSKKIKVINKLNNLLEKKEVQTVDKISVESDWSSASYIYSIVALANKGSSILLNTYYENSLQGDIAIIELYKKYFNIDTIFFRNKPSMGPIPPIKLEKINQNSLPERIELDLNNCPDIAQTIMVTAAALKIPFKLTGLHTLKIKETDRLLAMQTELAKFNVETTITEDSIVCENYPDQFPEKATITTYKDHRMAMAFAPFALKGIELTIESPEVVEKSYPNFWKDLKQLNFTIN